MMKTSIAKFAAAAAVAVIALPGVASAGRGGENPDPPKAGRCTGTPFVLVKISELAEAEKDRARKVNRNDNNYVCRKDIPGQGGGNTGQNSNIKDDKL